MFFFRHNKSTEFIAAVEAVMGMAFCSFVIRCQRLPVCRLSSFVAHSFIKHHT